MLKKVFEILNHELEAYFNEHAKEAHSNMPKTIDFLESQNQQDLISFPVDRVTPLLINLEEENTLRPAERHSRITIQGKKESIPPDIRLSLYVLFVSNFNEYGTALHYLGLIIRYFQTHSILNSENVNEFPADIDRLTFELITMPFSEQNEVWNSLRSAYRPSLLYKIRMVVFQSEPILDAIPEVSGTEASPSLLDHNTNE